MTSKPAHGDDPAAVVALQRETSRWDAWFDRLLGARGVVAFWLAYGLIHVGLRMFMSGALSLDDARANETAQMFALGYQVRQPPLYSWLLWSFQQFVGTGPASLFVLRYALVASIGVATYSATKTVLAVSRQGRDPASNVGVAGPASDRQWAALASLSLLFTYSVGWTFHEWATETLLLSLACLLTVRAAICFMARPGWPAAVGFGLAVGLGLLSKYSYLLCLVALVLAISSLADVRRCLADRRLIASLAIVPLMLAPFVWWLAAIHGDLAATTAANLIQSEQSHPMRALVGIARLAWSLPAFLMPWLAIVTVLTWPALGRPMPETNASASSAERIVLRTMLIGALLTAAGIVAIGATNIGERYMHPVLMIAPVYVFARLARQAPATLYARRVVMAALVTALAILPVRVLSFENEIFGKPTRPNAMPFAGLAKALSQRGFADGTFVAVSVRVAGNLRQYLPDIRYLAKDSFLAVRPPRRSSDDRSCALVWSEAEANAARALAPDEGLAADRIDVREPSVLGWTRHGVWFVTPLDPASRLCS